MSEGGLERSEIGIHRHAQAYTGSGAEQARQPLERRPGDAETHPHTPAHKGGAARIVSAGVSLRQLYAALASVALAGLGLGLALGLLLPLALGGAS